ncbi:hypothetical protein AC579_8055 [Pseudocercospora musae]|uniref:CST complex subunit Stn1 N-terminal domain-containing protein n=1 Tax=Pseudocercospora musae TaxID=113226 RepID=A0A139IPC8_9PEZI|nr:hypothetical protein AC579_8055 [Pseudocercospora musae]
MTCTFIPSAYQQSPLSSPKSHCQNAMNNARSGELYPAKYYDASPTWYRWNKLSVADVYQLRQEPGFEGQNIWFWLNHPIQYVRLVGLICQVDMVAGGRYVLMTLDDSSGANIEIKLERGAGKVSENGFKEYLPITDLHNVLVRVEMGLPIVTLDRTILELGTIVIAEGQIGSYMHNRQMVLSRLQRVPDTRAEAQHWAKAAVWKGLILSKPWVLSTEKMLELDQNACQEARKELKEQTHRKKKSAKREMLNEQREKRRELEEVQMNKGALPGSEVLKMPWDD